MLSKVFEIVKLHYSKYWFHSWISIKINEFKLRMTQHVILIELPPIFKHSNYFLLLPKCENRAIVSNLSKTIA